MKKRNPPNFDSSEYMPQVGGVWIIGTSDLPRIRRHGRREEARRLRREYIYGSSMDRKTCIWSCGGDSWLDKSSGISWVGVHGMDSICVVSRTGDLDIKRVRGNLKKHTIESFLHHFRKAVISEIEDLEDPSSTRKYLPDPNLPNKLRQGQCVKKPFGIVSVGTDEDDKESGHEAPYDEYKEKKHANRILVNRILEGCKHMLAPVRGNIKKGTPYSLPTPAQRDEENTIKFLKVKMKTDTTFMINETVQALEYDEEKAIKYLREKMESGVAFTMDETIQAAISAFQQLFRKKFKANEIGVTVVYPDYTVSEIDANHRLKNAKELEIHDIEKHLAVINEPGCGGSSSGGKSTVNSTEEEEDMDENWSK